jgi:hypothetical protein
MRAEGEGFEPPDLSVNRFQDGRNRPLCHPSGRVQRHYSTADHADHVHDVGTGGQR